VIGGLESPDTHYAKTPNGVHIAYQVVGNGPPDVVYANSFMGNAEASWEYPPAARFYNLMAQFCRLMLFDRRGTGLSDPIVGDFSIEERTADIAAVLDAEQLTAPALLGSSEGATSCAYFAATHPDRVSALVLFSPWIGGLEHHEFPWVWTPDFLQLFLAVVDEEWADPSGGAVPTINPSLAGDSDACAWYAKYFRLSASPALVKDLMVYNSMVDIRSVLSTITVPTLVLHRTDESWVNVEYGRFMARFIPGAKLVEFPGTDHYIWEQNAADVVEEIEEFLTGVRRGGQAQRALKTLLFADVVQSTNRVSEIGDEAWRQVLDRYESSLRRQVARFDGQLVKTTGDGLLACFDGPARAIRCGLAIRESTRAFGLEVRTGIHAGEVELRADDVGGISVHIAARVEEKAEPGEVLVSRTVTDLVAGSGIGFEGRGEHELKGVPGSWKLFAVKG
jgi:pimeloyl-ACP methyl ester carboxylesterase